MRRTYPKTDAEGIAAEIMKDKPPHEPQLYEFVGATFVGDVWYSSIHSYIKTHWGKKSPNGLFSDVCDILSKNRYWVHS